MKPQPVDQSKANLQPGSQRVSAKKALFEGNNKSDKGTSRAVDTGVTDGIRAHNLDVKQESQLTEREITVSSEQMQASIAYPPKNKSLGSEYSTVNDEFNLDTLKFGRDTLEIINEWKDTEAAAHFTYRRFNNDFMKMEINILKDNMEKVRATNNYLRQMVAILVSANAASFLGETVPFELKMAVGVVIYVILNKFLEPLFFGLSTLFKKIVDSIVLLSAKIADTERVLLRLMIKSINVILAISVFFAAIHRFKLELGVVQLLDMVIEFIRTNQLDKAAQDIIENSYTQYGAYILLILLGMGAVNTVCNTVMNWFISRLLV